MSLVVDVGGGRGRLLATILERYPRLRGILFDQPHVIEGARPILDAAGVVDRCELVGGSFFDAVPAGGDAYILRGIIPGFEDDQAVAILTNCRRAMAAGARVLLVERYLAHGPARGAPGSLLRPGDARQRRGAGAHDGRVCGPPGAQRVPTRPGHLSGAPSRGDGASPHRGAARLSKEPIDEEAVVNERNPRSGSAFRAIRAIDYTVIFVRDMAAMRRFYEGILGFPLLRELSPGWIEYRVGDNTLALATPGRLQQMLQRPAAAPRFSWHSGCPLPKLTSAPTSWCGRASPCSHRPLTSPLDIARCSSVIRTEICWRCSRTSSLRRAPDPSLPAFGPSPIVVRGVAPPRLPPRWSGRRGRVSANPGGVGISKGEGEAPAAGFVVRIGPTTTRLPICSPGRTVRPEGVSVSHSKSPTFAQS